VGGAPAMESFGASSASDLGSIDEEPPQPESLEPSASFESEGSSETARAPSLLDRARRSHSRSPRLPSRGNSVKSLSQRWKIAINTFKFVKTFRFAASAQSASRLSAEASLNRLNLWEAGAAQEDDDIVLKSGAVNFRETESSQKPAAQFVTVHEDTDALKVLEEDTFKKLRPPGALLMVAGSAQDWNSNPHLVAAFTRGLANAARATDAWVITSGTDGGVVALVGKAFSGQTEDVPVIGIPVLQRVTNGEHFFGSTSSHGRGGRLQREVSSRLSMGSSRSACSSAPFTAGPRLHQFEKVLYVRNQKNSDASVAIDHNHSHFVFVQTKGGDWGSEVPWRTRFEKAVCSHYAGIPAVLLVVRGGTSTLASIDDALERQCPVVLIKESGGCSQVIANFIEPFVSDLAHWHHRDQKAALQRKIDDYMKHEFRAQMKAYLPATSESNYDLYGKALSKCADNMNLMHIFSVKEANLSPHLPFSQHVTPHFSYR